MIQDGIENISEKEFVLLADFLKSNYGISLSHQKKMLVEGRLTPVLVNNHFQNFSQYFNYVLSDTSGKAIVTLLDKITTNHTYFMREAEHFNYFRDKVLPYLEACVKDRDLRIWSAGCSTGEEPYTLAMIIDEYFKAEKAKWNTRILATDISTHALETAKKGEYTEEQLEHITKYWRLEYFQKSGGDKNTIIEKIRNEVLFRRFNLMEKVFPFRKKFHVIFCRNVMIYFDTETKRELVRKFFDFTEPGGYLFIGHSETLNTISSDYRYILPALYRKEQ